MKTQDGRVRMLALGSDTWRFYIDLDRQHRGSAAFDEGMGGVREPGYLDSVLRAHENLAEGAGQEVSLADYVALQQQVTAHAPADGLWRPGRCWVHMPRVAVEPGLAAYWTTLGVTLDEAAPARQGYVRVMMGLHAKDPAAVEADVARRLDAGQAAIRAADPERRVAAVAALHQDLELLHPTRDANTRRHLVLLQRLLVDAGLPPCILTEPNHVYVRTPASWARCVREGMDRWRAVHHAHQRGLDVPRTLMSFDIRRRPLGTRLGRWHHPESAGARWLVPGR